MALEIANGIVLRVDGISKVTLAELRALLPSSLDRERASELADDKAQQFAESSRMTNHPQAHRTYWAGQARRWRAISKALRVELPTEVA